MLYLFFIVLILIVDKLRVVHAGCGMNVLSGMQNISFGYSVWTVIHPLARQKQKPASLHWRVFVKTGETDR